MAVFRFHNMRHIVFKVIAVFLVMCVPGALLVVYLFEPSDKTHLSSEASPANPSAVTVSAVANNISQTATNTYTKGIDVSHYQGTVDWQAVAVSGVRFAYIKATDGIRHVDHQFHTNWQGVAATDIHRGAYHFFLPQDDPVAQAKHFVATIGDLGDTDLPPVLDIEIANNIKDATIEHNVLVWLETVEKATGRRPIVYTDNAFADDALNDKRFTRYPLWIADYASKIHKVPGPWQHSQWKIWQYSSQGKVAGIESSVDLDKFNGSLSALQAFIADSHIQSSSIQLGRNE